MSNPYQVLGLETHAPIIEVTAAFRRLSMKWHPDHNPGDPKAETKFKQLSEAYDIIKRGKWSSSSSNASSSSNTSKKKGKKPPITATYSFNFKEAFVGANLRSYPDHDDYPEPYYIGGGVLDGDTFDGGNVTIRIEVTNDTDFVFQGRDLHAKVSFEKRFLKKGMSVEVPSVDVLGNCVKKKMKLPDDFQTGGTLKIYNEGFPVYGKRFLQKGHLYIAIKALPNSDWWSAFKDDVKKVFS